MHGRRWLVERDEVVGHEVRADVKLRSQRAHGADREHAVAPGSRERAHVAHMVDAVRGDVAVETVPLEQDVPPGIEHGHRSRDPARVEANDWSPERGAVVADHPEDRVAPDDTQESHPGAGYRPLGP